MKSLIFSLFLSLFPIVSFAYYDTDCGPTAHWSIENETLFITGSGEMHDFGEYGRAPWAGRFFREVIIGDSITHIGSYAFYSGYHANGGQTLELRIGSITIGKSVISIGDNAFKGLETLRRVLNFSNLKIDYIYTGKIHDEPIQIIDKSSLTESINGVQFAFFHDTIQAIGYNGGKANLKLPETYNGKPYIIGDFAFHHSNLKSLTVPNTLHYIGNYAFGNIESLIIGEGVSYIGESACNARKIFWLANTPPKGYENYSAYSGQINYVPNNLYSKLKSDIKIYPFLSSKFESNGIIYIPVSPSERTCDAVDCTYDEIFTIHIGAITQYSGIELKILNINDYTCYGNTVVTGITLNNNGYVGKQAFGGCKELESLNINNKGDIKEWAFYGTANGKNATAQINNKGNIGERAFYNSHFSEVVIGDSVISIGESCFDENRLLKVVKLGKNVNNIGDGAFSKCDGLKEIIIPNSVKNLGKSVFQNCNSLCKVIIGNQTEKILPYTFAGCVSLNELYIGNSVTDIGDNTFDGCTSLPSVTIPMSVNYIGNNAFKKCTALTNVAILDRKSTLTLGKKYNLPLFSDCPLDSVYIGGKIVYDSYNGFSPFYRNTSLRSVKISDAETTIYDNEFYGCTNLQNVSIGDSVKSIGRWAFSGCNSLSHFDFGSGLQSIGQEAFSDCNNVTEISSEALVPPTCGTNALDDINKWTCKLTVPKASMEAYKQAEQWKEFFFIEENTTGIHTMTSDKEPRSDVYSLTGAKVLDNASLQDVQSLPKGIYVIKGKKIIVK